MDENKEVSLVKNEPKSLTDNSVACYCTECGSKIYAGAKFCAVCGAQVHGLGGKSLKENDMRESYIKKMFCYEGRVNRQKYILNVLPTGILNYMLMKMMEYIDSLPLLIISLLISLLLMIYVFMFAIRRCHDIDRSGWYCLLSFVPVVNFVWGIYLMCKKGTDGVNKYGDDPLRSGN